MGSVQVLGCVESAETQAPCPSGHAIAVVEVSSFNPSGMKFQNYEAEGVFSVVFVSTLSCYLIARSFGIILGMLR